MHRIQPSLFDEVFSLDCNRLFLEFVQKYFLIFIVVFVINLIVFFTYSSKLLARKKFVFKIVVILNAGVCTVSGLVCFFGILREVKNHVYVERRIKMKKIVSILLTFSLAISSIAFIMPQTAFAANENENVRNYQKELIKYRC